MTVVESIEIILGILILAGSSYWLIAIYAVNRFFGPVENNSSLQSPPVSILKPLKGIDSELARNIGSFCEQDYREYELVLGFNKPGDTELREATRIVDAMSFRNARIVSSECELGANQKVSNLQGILDECAYPLIALSDSDMRVDKDYLRTIVSEYQAAEDIGMVTCLYKISDPKSCGAAFESMSNALDFLPSVLVAERLEGVSFGLGASMLFSRSALDEIGGFRAVADYLADDYQIGNRISKKGLKIVISKYVVEDMAGRMDFPDYFRHQLRWARTVRASRPAGYFGSGISHIISFAILLCIFRGADPISLSALAFAVSLRFAMAALVYNRVIKTRSWLKWLILMPVKDILAFLIWIGAFVGSKVTWRGAVYDIIRDGRIRKTG
jgi:ceramide glucosyltransferase